MLKSKSLLVITALLGFLILPNMSSVAQTIYIKKAPPAKKLVIKTSSPFPNAVWVNSHWKWKGAKYVWIKGYWTKPRHGYIWVSGHWVKTKRGWYWKKGHWKPV